MEAGEDGAVAVEDGAGEDGAVATAGGDEGGRRGGCLMEAGEIDGAVAVEDGAGRAASPRTNEREYGTQEDARGRIGDR